MDARSKALRTHRKRLRARRMKRVEVTVHEQDAALVRTLAAKLRRDDAEAGRVRAMLRGTDTNRQGPTLSEILSSMPDISGPEFDEVFEAIKRFRHDPITMTMRDIDL